MNEDEFIDAPSFKLDTNDRQSPVWRKLKTHYWHRLQELRARNDSDLDPIATARLRGEIRGVVNLLALGDQDPATEVDAD